MLPSSAPQFTPAPLFHTHTNIYIYMYFKTTVCHTFFRIQFVRVTLQVGLYIFGCFQLSRQKTKMSFVSFPYTFIVSIACLAVTVVPSPLSVEILSTTSYDTLSSPLSSRGLEDKFILNSTTLTTMSTLSDVINHVAAKETSLGKLRSSFYETTINCC